MKKYVYPACKTVDVKENWFGTELPDPYVWLKQAKDPEVLDFVARENAYTDEYFKAMPVAEKTAELKAAAIPELPMYISPYGNGYVGTVVESGNYHVRVLDAGLQDAGAFPAMKGLEEYQMFEVVPSPVNGRYAAAMIQYPGDPRPTVAVYDMQAEKVLFKQNLCFSFCWSKADGCMYTATTDSDPAAQTSKTTFMKFDPEACTTTDVLISDEYCIFGQVFPSDDGEYVLALVSVDYSSGIWYAIHTVDGVSSRLNTAPVEQYYMDSRAGRHYFITMSGAANGKVISVGTGGDAETVLPESSSVILESGFAAGKGLYALGKKDVNACLISVDDGKEVQLPGSFAALSVPGKAKDGVFLKYESFLTAPQILHFADGVFTLVRATADEDNSDLQVEQKFAPSDDGTMIPYYVVSRRDIVMDGSTPAVMYAYGGYNISMPPWHTEMVTQLDIPRWVRSGGVYVHINNRGGNEYGPKWHEAGMMMTKRHCYEDFISVAEAVIAQGYTSKRKIGITGCSNGGLLMSALVTMRPDLWGCVIDSVPHTDMIHFAEDDRGPMYITEYGNPRESKEMFEYLLSYSPYHNVRAVDYPPTYIQTGEMDNNVPPYHGKKFAARMQAMNTSDNPILLRVLALGSHDRGAGEVYWRTISEMQCFLEQHLKG